jgi:enoyl-CoA hydratase/carnithine racemase
MSLADAYLYTSGVMKENTMRSDAKEGISAFLEKRDPSWPDPEDTNS